VAYEGPEYWYVIYKAVGDFSGLMRDAAQAKAALQGMADAVKAETAAEVAGSTQAAAARQKDTVAIRDQTQALAQAATAAEQANQQLLYGGRTNMAQHLSDIAQELNYTTLLNRQHWLGFSSVQQAMSYRQQMYQLALLENKAHFAGYLTADQYLGFMQREIAGSTSQAAAIRARAAAIGIETAAMLAYDNAVLGTHQSLGQLGGGASAYAAALTGLPSVVTTQALFDDAPAIAQIAAYRASLAAIPRAESLDILSSSMRTGIPLVGQEAPRAEPEPAALPPSAVPPVVFRSEFDDQKAESGLQAFVGDLTDAVREKYVFRPELDDTAVNEALDTMMERAREIKAPTTLGMGGTSGGGGGGSPGTSESAWSSLLDDWERARQDAAEDAPLFEEMDRALGAVGESAAETALGMSAAGKAAIEYGVHLGDAVGNANALAAASSSLTQQTRAARAANLLLAMSQEVLNQGDDGRIRGILASIAATGSGTQALAGARLALEYYAGAQDQAARSAAELAVANEGAAGSFSLLGYQVDDYTARLARDALIARAALADLGFNDQLAIGPAALRRELEADAPIFSATDEELRGIGESAAEAAQAMRDDDAAAADLGDVLEGHTVPTIADAVANIRALADASGSSYQKLLALNAITRLLGISQEDLNASSDDALRDMIRLAAEADSLTAAYGAANAAARRFEEAASTAGAGGGAGQPPTPTAPGAADGGDDAEFWRSLEAAMKGTDDEAVRSAATSKAAGAAAGTAGNAARTAGGLWGFWGRQLTLFAGVFSGVPLLGHISVWALALHTLLDFFIVLVPAVVAAGVALGAFAVAIEPAAKDVYNRFLGLHTALDALSTGNGPISQATQHIGFLSDQMGTLNATMKPLPVSLRSLQTAMAPEAVTLYGAAINIVTRNTGLLQSIVKTTGTWVEDLAVKIQSALANRGSGLSQLINTAVNDLRILGSIGGSLAQLFGELLRAGELTHVSELLFEGIAYALSVVAKALAIVGPYATAVGIAFFAVVHYGGLLASALVWVVTQLEFVSVWLVTLLGNLPLVGGAFDALGASMKTAFATVPAGGILAIAAAIAAVGYAIYSAAQASSQAKSYVAGLQQALASDNASQGFARIQTNLASIGQWLTAASTNQRNFVGNMAQGWSDLFRDASGFGLHLSVYKDLWEAITGTNQQPGSTALVLREQTAEQKDWTTTLAEAADATKKYGTTAQESFALMDLAGVKVTDNLATQQTKVDDLVTGWLNMGVAGYQLKNGMNQLGAAINAVTLSSELQSSSIATLTADFTAFLTLTTQGQTALDAFGSGIYTVATNLKAAGASMGGVNAASFTLRQSWESQLSSGQTLYNNLLEQNAAAGNTAKTNAALAASGRDLVSIMLAQGGAGEESVQGTYALAQSMGYTGKATYDALEKWSGGNHDVTGTLKDLNKQVGTLQTGSSNLSTDVLNLAAAVGTNLTQAIANGLVAMPQITKAVAGLYQYILTNRKAVANGPTAQEVSLSTSVANALIAVYGTTPQGLDQAKNEFVATLTQMGVKRAQALQLWAADTTKATNTLPNLTPLQNRLRDVEGQLGKPITPTLNLTPLQSRLAEMQRDYGQAYNPPPGYMAQSDANTAKLARWFTDTLPHAANVGWNAVYTGFFNDVNHPLSNFFNKQIPEAYNASNNALIAGWQAFNRWWDGNIRAPWDQFWNNTVTGWFISAGTALTGVWVNVSQGFGHYLVSDVGKFFNSQMPNWFDGLGRDWNKFWSQGWTDFSRGLVQPMERWFTTTMPNAIWGGLKGGIDRAIGGMNTVIGFINSVTGVVGVHISPIPKLARGGGVPMASGSVPGTGDEDGTHIIAMGGEYMLRKPARMALQAAYGPDFMDHLNNADAWLGSGSRGNAASQRRPATGRYAGGGIINNIGNWLGDVAGDVGSLAKGAWSGVAGAARDVARYGEKAVFDAMWSVSGAPAEAGLEHLGTPGDMAASWVQQIHNGVENYINGQTSKAEAAGSSLHPTGAGATIQKLMQSMAASVGWTGANWSALNNVEMREAGYNLSARNPTSGAYGLAQFINGPSEYAQYGGSSASAVGQITAMINYIKDRYGTPVGAWAHELADGWYAGGGPVVSALKSVTGNLEQRESMALASWLLSRWDATAKDPSADEYGAWLTNLRKHKGFTAADAYNPTKAARLMEPYYRTSVNSSSAARWKSQPEQAALYAAAIAQTAAGTSWHTPDKALLTEGWKQVGSALAVPPVPTSSVIPKADVTAWARYAGQIHPQWQQAFIAWQDLYQLNKRPAAGYGPTNAQWLQFDAERTAAALAEKNANKAVDALLGARAPTTAEWQLAGRDLASWDSALGAMNLGRQYHPEFWANARADVGQLEKDVAGKSTRGMKATWQQAFGNWQALYQMPRPAGGKAPTQAQWNTWMAQRAGAALAEKNANAALSPIFADVNDPAALTSGDWTAAERSLTGWAAALRNASVGKEYRPEAWGDTYDHLQMLEGDVAGAAKAWQGIWGEYLIPGITVRNPGNAPVTVDLNSLIVGGPGGGSPGGDYGFGLAGGGGVPAAVSSMFGAGMAAGGVVPNLFLPGLSATMQSQLSSQATGTMPRSLSEAAGRTVGLEVGQLTINNPRPEKPSDSITRSSNRLAFLAGRGIALCPARRWGPTPRMRSGTSTGSRCRPATTTWPPSGGRAPGCRRCAARTTRCPTGRASCGGPSTRTSAPSP
jgi:hypothetical protein